MFLDVSRAEVDSLCVLVEVVASVSVDGSFADSWLLILMSCCVIFTRSRRGLKKMASIVLGHRTINI